MKLFFQARRPPSGASPLAVDRRTLVVGAGVAGRPPSPLAPALAGAAAPCARAAAQWLRPQRRRLPGHAARAALLRDHQGLTRAPMLLTAGEHACCSRASRPTGAAAPVFVAWSPAWRAACQRAIPTMDRRAFLRRSGLGVGVGLATSQLTLVRKAQAADAPAAAAQGKVEVKRTVCAHCSVGCAVDAVVENGVWVRQEPVFDSPINLGAHCAKGAALREHGHGEYRLKYPMKLVNGKYQRISWDQALDEISAKMLELRKQSGPDSIFVVGSSKHNNEQSYLLRKWVSLWGTNNCDHQARICHSTTVAGVANTWGYGAMTNSYNDMQQLEGGAVHRLQRGRGAPGVACCTCCTPRKPAAR